MMSMAKVFTLACVLVTKTGAFILQQKGDEDILKDTLIRDLTATFRRGHDEDRLLHFEEAVMPMFQALPKKFKGEPWAGNSTSCSAPIVLAPPRMVDRRSAAS